MVLKIGSLRQRLFGRPLVDINDIWQDSDVETRLRQQLIAGINSFITGYNTALEVGLTPSLYGQLQSTAPDFRTFAYEGAGMGMAMIDCTTPGKGKRLLTFAEQASNYTNLAYIGAGFTMAVLNRSLKSTLGPIDPMYRWWVVDGCGFYHGLFHWEKAVVNQWVPPKINGYGQRAFDRGIGRSLWFKINDNIDKLIHIVQAFPEHRRADLWSGIGVMSTYLGDCDKDNLLAVKTAAGTYASYVALGAALSATARHFANNISEHHNVACAVYCGMSAETAAKLAIELEQTLTIDPDESVFESHPIFETHREKIRSCFVSLES